ncbi:MAG: hypothetical protein AAGC68_00295 [Verrucomicrobiota bacterium]
MTDPQQPGKKAEMAGNCIRILLLIFLLFAPAGLRGERRDVPWKQQRFETDVLRAEARSKFDEFQNNYESALERLQERFQNEGNLDAALAIQKERNEFRDRQTPIPSDSDSIASLNELRKVYEVERQKKIRSVVLDEIEVLAAYLGELNRLTTELTQQGEVELAVAARDEATAIATEIEELNRNPTLKRSTSRSAESEEKKVVLVGPGGSFQRHEYIETKEDNGLLVLTSSKNGAWIRSEEEFAVPFRIQARAMTDSTNIRIYYGKRGIFVLNWEVNPDELRFRNPLSGRSSGTPGKGKIETNKLHDIEIDVMADRIVLRVDREERFVSEGNYSNVEGPVSIGPAFRSKVSIDYFAVSPLEL